MLQAVKRYLDIVVLAIAVPLTVIMLGCVVWQVVARYFLGVSTSITDELARFLFIWVSLLGAAYVLGKRGHIAITGLVDIAPPAVRRGLELFSLAMVLAFSLVVLVWGGSLLVDKAARFGQVSPAIQAQMSWVYLVIPLSGLLTALYCVLLLIETLVGRRAETRQVSLD